MDRSHSGDDYQFQRRRMSCATMNLKFDTVANHSGKTQSNINYVSALMDEIYIELINFEMKRACRDVKIRLNEAE